MRDDEVMLVGDEQVVIQGVEVAEEVAVLEAAATGMRSGIRTGKHSMAQLEGIGFDFDARILAMRDPSIDDARFYVMMCAADAPQRGFDGRRTFPGPATRQADDAARR
jgi:hypothetical protein